MRKRSKYRPRPMLVDPLGYVLEGTKPINQHDSYLLDLKLKNHGSLAAILQGSATKADINTLIAVHNVQEAISRLIASNTVTDLPIQLDTETMAKGKAALLELSARSVKIGKFVCKATEIQALNELMAMHDELMDMLTIRHMEKAIAFAKNEIASKRAIVVNKYIPQNT